MGTRKVIVNGTTILDLTDATADATKIVSGYTAYGADGDKISGSAVLGYDTSDATAYAGAIKRGLTAYISSGKVTGTAPSGNMIHSSALDVDAFPSWTSPYTAVAYTLRENTFSWRPDNNGAMFRANTSNNGVKVIYYTLDVRPYSHIYVSGRHFSNQSVVARNRAEILVGTATQMRAIRYDNASTSYGCANIGEFTSGNQNADSFTITADISSITSGATDPIYIGFRLNSYYGSYNHIRINEWELY